MRGDLLARLGRTAQARLEFERAAALTANATERAFLRRRASELRQATAVGATLGEAVRRFLERDGLHPALLPELIADRSRGLLFRTDRRPGPAAARSPSDRCPHTGRQRLSYERAEYLFKRATRQLDPAARGYTLRQLRSQLRTR